LQRKNRKISNDATVLVIQCETVEIERVRQLLIADSIYIRAAKYQRQDGVDVQQAYHVPPAIYIAEPTIKKLKVFLIDDFF
jgi:hypothetical protein